MAFERPPPYPLDFVDKTTLSMRKAGQEVVNAYHEQVNSKRIFFPRVCTSAHNKFVIRRISEEICQKVKTQFAYLLRKENLQIGEFLKAFEKKPFIDPNSQTEPSVTPAEKSRRSTNIMTGADILRQKKMRKISCIQQKRLEIQKERGLPSPIVQEFIDVFVLKIKANGFEEVEESDPNLPVKKFTYCVYDPLNTLIKESDSVYKFQRVVLFGISLDAQEEARYKHWNDYQKNPDCLEQTNAYTYAHTSKLVVDFVVEIMDGQVQTIHVESN